MRVFVTGCHGYIGSVLTPRLRAQGHPILGIDSDLFADCLFGDSCADAECRRRERRQANRARRAGARGALCQRLVSQHHRGYVGMSA